MPLCCPFSQLTTKIREESQETVVSMIKPGTSLTEPSIAPTSSNAVLPSPITDRSNRLAPLPPINRPPPIASQEKEDKEKKSDDNEIKTNSETVNHLVVPTNNVVLPMTV
ncbi:hypothetical protein WR25_19228 [Diploscapter pachys]|uniref:Uncharacterized protein n=1 Tax=Diploscapter pachys TaxID=2018661 RepID=A0A2A2KWG5_9BILA|nr:hypothetical protein WR25_19228 [Diploscapter pachys]